MWLASYTHNVIAFSLLFIIFPSASANSLCFSLSFPLVWISSFFQVKRSRRRIVSERRTSVVERKLLLFFVYQRKEPNIINFTWTSLNENTYKYGTSFFRFQQSINRITNDHCDSAYYITWYVILMNKNRVNMILLLALTP